jgi:hypothetical protein
VFRGTKYEWVSVFGGEEEGVGKGKVELDAKLLVATTSENRRVFRGMWNAACLLRKPNMVCGIKLS